MENINDYVEEMNNLEKELNGLEEKNKKYANVIKKMKMLRNVGVILGMLLIPYLAYITKNGDLTKYLNIYLSLLGPVLLGDTSYSFVADGIFFIEQYTKQKSTCEKDIDETKQLLKETTIEHDNCITSNLETKLCILEQKNKDYANVIKKMKMLRNIGITLGILLIPYLAYMYISEVSYLTENLNICLSLLGPELLSSTSYSLILNGIFYAGHDKKQKNICEKNIDETKRLLKETTIKHDNCLANNLEKIVLFHMKINMKTK